MSASLLTPYLFAGDGVIDLGANVGRYSAVFAAVVGPQGHVLAVEPDPAEAAKLRKETAAQPQMHVVEAAVGAVAETRPLYVDRADRRRNSLWAANVITAGEECRCAVRTLDDLAQGVPNLTAIKVDVQGAECHVLDGAAETLARDLVWLVEVWPVGLMNAGRSVEELASRFQAHGIELVLGQKPRDWAEVVSATRTFKRHQSIDVVLRRCA